MKTARTLFRFASILVAASLALGAALEHREQLRQTEDNRALRQQLSQMVNLLAINQPLSAPAVQVDRTTTGPRDVSETQTGSNPPTGELVRLRNEVDELREQYRQLETLRADTARTHAAIDQKRHNAGQAGDSSNADNPGFEIVSASYWTANTNMDVAAELQDRVRGNRLKAVASNNIKGDPEYGQTKHLTVVYRIGGVIRTNDFREGDVIVLPPEQSGSE
jgi:hypothetical protein